MPRPLRPALAGGLYHITTRGVARCAGEWRHASALARPRVHRETPTATRGRSAVPTARRDPRNAPAKRRVERCHVYTDAVDRTRFLEMLAATVLRHGWRCHTYCLMGTHYHLLVETPEPDVSAGVQYLNGRYAQWFNLRHERAGHLFGARFHHELVQTEAHFLEVCRYIVRNPVRAGLCAHPHQWRWSSYSAIAGARPQPLFLTVNWLLELFAPDRDVARERYRLWVAAGAAVPVPIAA